MNKRHRHSGRHLEKFIFPAPAVLFVVAMLVFPIGYTLYLSLHQWSGGLRPPEFLGLENFQRMFASPRFWGSILRTVYFVGLSVGLQVLLGMLAALVFHRPFFGRSVARTLYMFPLIATPTAMALVWKMILDPTIGSVSYLTQALGAPNIAWTAEPAFVIPTLALVDTWQWTPLVMLIVLSGLAALPKEPYEAGKLDGANAFQLFRHITLPLIRPILIIAAMFRVIDCIKTFDIIMVITAGGPGYSSEILNIYAFREALTYFHLGYGSALLVVLTILVFAVALLLNRVRRRNGGLT